ncbi:DUF4238 domain-containing protein [Bradyrhizobium barranii subsp. apii]|uniref:DUF4238 domain-containing protein n=1 Tax=Bradyrhizobium barranii TaxID=2992140 RepID=UPI001AA1A430|nr:DUF4238 domain-containing protein [Bradyrhizobium barranii]UPT97737.1 DUF4238 domain-containing protein [Bradyrhizobium barranii subsp. apii]
MAAPGAQHTKRNHYVPQFYMRQFALDGDKTKVKCLSRHDPYVSIGTKSISRIGYEEDLYTFSIAGSKASIEDDLNKNVETPIANSDTWRKILAGEPDRLDRSDKLTLYLLMRHLQFRNIENLRFIEQEAVHAREIGFRDDYSEDEREMYAELSRTAAGPRSYFLAMAADIQQFALHWDRASISVIRSRIPLRSSTNPTLVVPRKLGHIRLFEELEADAFCYWLPLSRYFGAMLTMSRRFNDFIHQDLPDDAARVFNRLYLGQLLEMPSTRHCFADDPEIEGDLHWAGFDRFDGIGGRGRYKREIR